MNGMRFARRLVNHIRRRSRKNSNPSAATAPAISTDYTLLGKAEALGLDGWQARSVAERQHQAFMSLLRAARKGQPRIDFVVAARALASTGLSDPLVIEVGCGSGYYSELLPLLLGRPVRYVGLDYAASMTALARRMYPDVPFVTGDACHLPLKTASCDVLFSGTSIMHIAAYQQAIAESVRVTHQWCVFHTVPVMAERTTTLLRKQAYGEPVVEVIFNQAELESIFAAQGLVIRATFESIPYDVSVVVGEGTWTLTYLCEKNHG